MIKYELLEGGSVRDRERNSVIPPSVTNRDYVKYLKWVDAGNTSLPVKPSNAHELVGDAWTFKLDRGIELKIAELEAKFNIDRKEPTNLNGYMMDCDQLNAMTTQAGCDLAELCGETEVDIIDYYGDTHTLSLAAAREMSKLQGIQFRLLWEKFWTKVAQAKACTTETALNTVTWEGA